MLFYYGAIHPFVARNFVEKLNVESENLHNPYYVATPMKMVFVTNIMFRSYQIDINDQELRIDLAQIDLNDFDVILRMDWLYRNHAHIDCLREKIKFCILGRKNFLFKVN